MLSTVAASAQDPPPIDNTAAILERLEQQEAELEWLRSRLLEQDAARHGPTVTPAGAIGVDLPAESISATTHVGSATELDAIRQRLDALEQPSATGSTAKPDGAKQEGAKQEGAKQEGAKQEGAKQEGAKPDDGRKDLSDEKWTIKLGGHVQGDYILWPNRDPAITDPSARNYFEFRRLRLLADGTGYGVFDFRLQIDIEPEGEDSVLTPVTVVKDAYLTMHEVPVLNQVRFGNFFVPYSLEQVTNDTNNIFVERSIPTQGIFAADREVGAASYMISEDQNITWTGGAFFDSVSEATKERIDSNQGIRLSSRVTYLPYFDEPSGGRYLFHVGAGVLHTEDQDDIARYRARPQTHEGPRLIDSGNLPSPRNTTANVELATVWGPYSVQSELFLAHVEFADESSAMLYGSYIYGSYFLTGENRKYQRFGQHGAQFGRNEPFTNFFLVPGGFGSGAWELKCRWSYLDLGEVDAGQYNDITAGFNWYWSDRTRVMFDWIHPVTSVQTVFGETESDILAMRLDTNF